MSESWIEGEIKAALDEEYRPAPWLLANSMAGIRRARPARPALAWVAGVVTILLALGSIAVFESFRLTQKSNPALPNASGTASSARATAAPPSPATVGAVPAPRAGAALVWDAKDQYMLMFGGATHAADGRNATPNDTWAWIDRQWKLIKSSNAPPGRSFPAMAYDPVRQVVVMFGGGAANSDEMRNDTWAWDGIDWKELHPTSSPGRGYLRMAYDPERRALLLVRQSNLSTDPVETWSWTGTTWILLASGSTPSPRWFSSLCNDPVTGEVLLVGGYSGPPGDPNANKSETFTWHNGAWLQKQTGQPSPSGNVAASLDEKRHQVVLFAASGNETWTFDGSRWTKRTPTHGPVPLLAFGALGYDFSTGMVLLFGGKTDSIPGSPYLNELWGWDGSDWIRLYGAPPPGSPSASTFAAADCVLPADGSDTSIGDFVVKTPAGWSKTTDVGPTETLMIRFTAPVAYTHSPTTVEIGGLIGMFDSAREGGQRYFSTDPASKNMFDCQVAGGTASFFTSSDAEQSVVRIFLLHQRLLYMVTLRGTGGLDPRAITDTKSLLGSWTWVSKMMSAGGA